MHSLRRPGVVQGLTLKRHIEATLGQGNIREAVRLPPGEDLNEWLAVNTVDFYNAVSILYSTLEEFCTSKSCPAMTAGHKVPFALCVVLQAVSQAGPADKAACVCQYEYLWADGVKVKRPMKCSAPDYVNQLFDWIESQVRPATPAVPPMFQDLGFCFGELGPGSSVALVRLILADQELGVRANQGG